ncbi:uncharacterized protein prss56 [Thalassophryne amazonica]|uniref:uncharacterized protein prss56 n=1 Tax=Thalassophryne amazonica TaxID=390379 RepID=UPI00147099A0|nr:uncharacterized protein prss56 [Thalassophryne amazonica]
MLLVSLLLVGLDGFLGAPAGREVYRMPQSALKALSDRGTVVLEAAMASALSALERASSEKSRAEADCRGCVPCLFQDCGQQANSCLSPASGLSEPSCDDIIKAQKLDNEAERSWALSQACAYYRHRCQLGDSEKESCIRMMGESCSARVLQCSLLNTMQNLEPDTQVHTQAAVCGRRSGTGHNITQPRSRIVGGSPAPPGSWPWLVNLQLDGDLMCGGVLVDSSWVVTAAHCFAGSRSDSYWTAVVGEFDITKTDPDEQVLRVNRIIPHPKFNPKTFNNDIALVELTAPVVLSNHVAPVCLPSGTEPPHGSPCLLAGWGSLYEDGPSADVVMEAKVPLLPQSTCKSVLGKELVTSTMLCAGYLSGGVDSCQGDSGGPLIYQDHISGRFQLFGITSWGDGCGEKGKPGVYTRVSAFSDWIQAEIQKSFESREPTCPELLKTTAMSEEEQRSEFSSLCHFYFPDLPSWFICQLLQPSSREQVPHPLQKMSATFLPADTAGPTAEGRGLHPRQGGPELLHSDSASAGGACLQCSFHSHQRQTRPQPEPPGGAVLPEKQHPSAAPPGFFSEVGPLVDDWENYLKSVADHLDELKLDTSADRSTPPRQEDSLFLQAQDLSLHEVEGEYLYLISTLRSKLASRAPPPVLHLDTSHLQEETTSTTPVIGTLSSYFSQELQEPWSFLRALMSKTDQFRTQDGIFIGDGQHIHQTLSGTDVSLAVSLYDPSEGLTELTSSVIPLTVQSTTIIQPVSEDDSVESAQPLNPQRKGRSLFQKRQLAGDSGKICPGVRESSQRISHIRDLYRWVLNIPNHNLRMNFQEVLIDLSSKNNRGLYKARIKAVVAGRPLTFYSLVGLDNESFYRSAPRVIAVALDALKS